MKPQFQLIQNLHGFTWGPVRVSRMFSDPKHGVWLMLCGDKEQVTIRVTKGGRLRIGKPEPTDDHFKPVKPAPRSLSSSPPGTQQGE